MTSNRDESFLGKDESFLGKDEVSKILAGQVRELMKLVNETDISELRIEQGDLKLYIAKKHPSAEGAEADLPAAEETPSDQSFITAPMVGRFYLAAPGKAPLITCGELIATGQKICIVESMKIPNDILSEVDGQIEEILCEDGQAVEYGQSLFRVRLKPSGAPAS